MTPGVGASSAPRGTPDGRFWERFAALVVDIALVYSGLTACGAALGRAGIYIQLELSFAIAAASYATACIAWKGRTIGKALCGLAVQTIDGARPGFPRALARETVAKGLSAVPALLGFLWAALGSRFRPRSWPSVSSPGSTGGGSPTSTSTCGPWRPLPRPRSSIGAHPR